MKERAWSKTLLCAFVSQQRHWALGMSGTFPRRERGEGKKKPKRAAERG